MPSFSNPTKENQAIQIVNKYILEISYDQSNLNQVVKGRLGEGHGVMDLLGIGNFTQNKENKKLHKRKLGQTLIPNNQKRGPNFSKHGLRVTNSS